MHVAGTLHMNSLPYVKRRIVHVFQHAKMPPVRGVAIIVKFATTMFVVHALGTVRSLVSPYVDMAWLSSLSKHTDGITSR